MHLGGGEAEPMELGGAASRLSKSRQYLRIR